MDDTKEKSGQGYSYEPLITETAGYEDGEEEEFLEKGSYGDADMALAGYEGGEKKVRDIREKLFPGMSENDGEEALHRGNGRALSKQYERAMARMGDYYVPAGAKMLGDGGQAAVYDCLSFREPKEKSFDLVAKLYKRGDETQRTLADAAQRVNDIVMREIKDPYLVQILDHGLSEDEAYYMVVMRKYDSYKRKSYLKLDAEENIPKFQARFMREVWGLTRALGKLHERQIYHGDIKPKNLMFCPDDGGHLVLLDFGAGVVANEESSTSVTSTGISRPYAAPEKSSNRNLGRDSKYTDYYSLGLTMAELAAGVYPKKEELEHSKNKDMSAYWEQNMFSPNKYAGWVLPTILPRHFMSFFQGTLYYKYETGDYEKRWTTPEVKAWAEKIRRNDYEAAERMGEAFGSAAQPEPRREMIRVSYDSGEPETVSSTEEMAELFVRRWDETVNALLYKPGWGKRFYGLGGDVESQFEEAVRNMRAADGSAAKQEEELDRLLVKPYLSERIKKSRLHYRGCHYDTPVSLASDIRAVLDAEKKKTGGKYRLPDQGASGGKGRDRFVRMMEMFESDAVEKFFREGSWKVDKESIALAAEIRANLRNAGKNPQAKAVVIADLYRLAFRLGGIAVLSVLGKNYEDYGEFSEKLSEQYKKGSADAFEMTKACLTKDGRHRVEFYAFEMEAPGVMERPSLKDLEILP